MELFDTSREVLSKPRLQSVDVQANFYNGKMKKNWKNCFIYFCFFVCCCFREVPNEMRSGGQLKWIPKVHSPGWKKTEVSQPTSATSATPSTSLTTFTKIVSIRKTSTNCCFIIILSLAPVPSSHTWCFSVRRHRTETFGSGPGLLFSRLQRYGKLRSGPISRTVFRNGEASVTEVSFRTCGVFF